VVTTGGKNTKRSKTVKKKEPMHIKVLEAHEFSHLSEVSESDRFGDSQPARPFTEMMDIIDRDPRLQLALDTYVQMILGSGIKIKAQKKKIEKKIREWFDDIDFEEKLEDAIYSYVGAGNMFWEIEPKLGSDFVEIPVDTIVGIDRDRKGHIKNYIQFVNDREKNLKPNNIIQFKFTNSRQELWGRGLFHAVINDFTDPQTHIRYQAPIFAMKDIEDGLVKIIKSYASPIMMFHFKDAGESFIEKQGDVLKKARPGAKILTDKEFDVKIFEAKGDSKFDKYIEHIQRDVIEPGSQFPLQFFNAGFTARAASESTDSVLIRKIKRIKKRLTNELKEKFVFPYISKIDKTIKKDDFELIFEFDDKTEFDINHLVTLFRDNGIRRSELRQNLLKKTSIEIDPDDMEDLLPITSVTPTNDLGNDGPKPIPQRDNPEEPDADSKIPTPRGTKIEVEEEGFEDKHPDDCPKGQHRVDGKCVPIEEDLHDCMEDCLAKKKAAGIPIDDKARAICRAECEKSNEARHKKKRKKKREDTSNSGIDREGIL